MELFYVQPNNCKTKNLVLQGDEHHHLMRVMRCSLGDEVWATDGRGTLFRTKVGGIFKDHTELEVQEKKLEAEHPPFHLTLGLSLLKNPGRIEFAIEKCTEIGVGAFVPVTSSRTISQTAKTQRWHSIALAAIKQSCRYYLPDIKEVMELEQVLKYAQKFSLKLLAHEKSALPLQNVVQDSERHKDVQVFLLIGPEGGFTDEEVDSAEKTGFITMSLGSKRLRSETAAVVGSTLILQEA